MGLLDLLASIFGPKEGKGTPTPNPVKDLPAPQGKTIPVVHMPIQTGIVPANLILSDGFSKAFHEAFTKAMKWETGLTIDYSDPEIQAGKIDTPAQRKKCGYTDGVSGYSAHDSGGETKFGVAQNAHKNVTVRTLTLAQAMHIYQVGYWDAVCGDELNPEVAKYVFDIGCGSGPRKAITMLQNAIGVTQDGVMGPLTLGQVNHEDPKQLVIKLQQLRCNFYRSIVANNPSQGVFLNGWLNRANDI